MTGEVSDQLNVYFVPEGYVFSIWGVIYITLIAFVLSMFFSKRDDDNFLNGLILPFNIGLVSNVFWLLCWHYGYLYISLLFMVILLFSLIYSYKYIHNNRLKVTKYIYNFSSVLHSLYLSWISVATIANVTIVLYLLNWNGFGITPQIWSSIMIVIAGIFGIITYVKNKDTLFSFVLIWAIYGIAVKYSGEPYIFISSTVISVLLLSIIIYGKFVNMTIKR